jgi:hypothetical protein
MTRSLERPPTALRTSDELANEILCGRITLLGVPRTDLTDPDWFVDPTTAAMFDPSALGDDALRSSPLGGDVKYCWELSRHHHTTVLAAQYWLSGDDRFAEGAVAQIESWLRANPGGSGLHWVSGIEVGVRLIALVWTRRLLDGWPGAYTAFEGSAAFRRSVSRHMAYLLRYPSRGSSRNNHLVAEAVGLLVGSFAFPWAQQAEIGAKTGLTRLLDCCDAQTFDSGVNRELASEYHEFVLELLLVAATELAIARAEVPEELTYTIARMAAALSSSLDASGQPPHQGDGDDGRALMVEALTRAERVRALIRAASADGGAPQSLTDWVLSGGGFLRLPPPDAFEYRREWFPDSGSLFLRGQGEAEMWWARVDLGDIGYLSTAAHGHADTLSVEVRCGSTVVVADPGTYRYHSEPNFRRYFRSTRAHATIEVGGVDQAISGGPFLWISRPRVTIHSLVGLGTERTAVTASHDGYCRIGVRHTRAVEFLAPAGLLEILDILEGPDGVPIVASFPLGPEIRCELRDGAAELAWNDSHSGAERSATLELPRTLHWELVMGVIDPPCGWYSREFGERQPAAVLLGHGVTGSGELKSTLRPRL